MSDRTPEMILSTSPEAATYRTDINGWVSRHDRYFGENERAARYDGCTHVVCDCGTPVKKGWLHCKPCRDLKDKAAWEALPLIEWDGKTPLCVFRDDRYFFNADDVYDYADANDLKVSELQLIVCTPICAKEVGVDYWCDDLSANEDSLPAWLEKAVEQLNEVIAAHRHEPLSWYPGKQRVVLPDER